MKSLQKNTAQLFFKDNLSNEQIYNLCCFLKCPLISLIQILHNWFETFHRDTTKQYAIL